MDELKVENVPLNVIPVTEYDPFEAKFAASLYWLVFRATEDGEFENIPSQVTSPIQRDSEKRITVRPEVTEFLTSGEIYSKVCNNIFHGKAPAVGQWAIIQTLSRHGFYVVEEGDIAVTDSALQQKKPFRKSTHLALMDCLMSAFSARTVSVQQVVQSVSKFSSFNASKELPFDLEDALLLWINKICATLNDNQLKKQRQHAEQLLQNQDKAKRFRFRRDQLQPKVQTVFPVMEDLLKDLSDGRSLLGIVAFYHPSVISLEDIRFGTNLSTEDCVHNLDLFRSLCSQFICTSVLALKIEDLLYGSQAMKPNITALLAELFNVCEFEWQSPEIDTKMKLTSKSDIDQQCVVANKENFTDNRSLSNPLLLSENDINIGHGSPRENFKVRNGQISSMPGQLNSSSSERIQQVKSDIWKSQSDSQVNSKSRLSFKSPFQLDFTVDDDMQQPPLNEPLTKQDEHEKDKENPFIGIFQRPVLVRDRKLSLPNTFSVGGSPRVTPRQEHSLLARRNKQKQRTLDLEEWDMQQEEVEELLLNDLQRSQSLSGLDKAAPVEPRESFHAWREETGASLSDTNLSSSRNQRISVDFRPNLTSHVTQKGRELSVPQRGAEGIHAAVKSSGIVTKREEHTSQDSLSSVDSLNTRLTGDKPWESLGAVGVRDSYMSDISAKELSQFEEIEAKIQAGKSVETPRTFAKPKGNFRKAPILQDDEDELNTSVSSEDMNMFRLEVLQRLTEDKLRQIPDSAEMEDSDDPILRARNDAVSVSSNPSDQRAHLEVPDAPADDPSDQLSPIAETTEPLVSNPNSVTSANSTAPSSPCSPLDVAPFMPTFFTTSPASTLDRKSKRFSMKSREDMEKTLVGEEEDEFQGDPKMSATPRVQAKSGEKAGPFPSQSKSYEQLVRGSYTVGQVSVESAKAAGIPVIGEGRQMSEIVGSFEVASGSVAVRTNSSTSTSSDVFQSGKPNQTEADSSQDLSGFRPLILSSGGVETTGAATEAVDGRRDSLESSPAPSPALVSGKRDGANQEAALLARDLAFQDSPNDVVIFERSLSNPPEENSNSKTGQTEQHNTETIESHVFDFNQDTVENYKINLSGDFRCYKIGAQSGLAGREVFKANSPAASHNEDTADQRFQDVQQAAHFGTYSKKSHKDEQEQYTDGPDQASDSSDGRPHHRIVQETRGQGVRDLRHSDGFSTFRKDSLPQVRREEIEANGPALDLRLSDGFTTFRKGTTDALSGSLTARSSIGSTYDQRNIEADRFSTFSRKQKDEQGHDQESVESLHDTTASERSGVQQAPVSATPHSNKGGEGDERQAFPRGVEEVQTRSSGSSYITRSRTFRKTPDGHIVDDHVANVNTSSGHDRNTSLSSSGGKLSGQQTVVTNTRVSPEGAGSDNPHRISWTDEPEAGARLMKQLNASVDKKTAHENNSPAGSPRRRSSPRQTGRGSPGARISWLTAAKSGVGGQVMLNEKGEIEELEPADGEDDQAVTSQLAYLRMQLDEKRRHIEAEKHRAQAEWEDQRRRLGQTAFWYVIGKAQGGQAVGEGPGFEALTSDKATVMKSQSHDQPRKPEAEFPDQSSPPVAWSSPANSPLLASQHGSQGRQFETREFRLSDYPPRNDSGTNPDMTRPSSQPAAEASSKSSSVPTRPSSHDPAATRQTAPARKCWNVDVSHVPTPSPLVRPETAAVNMELKQETVSPEEGTGEIEVEHHTPYKKGLAMFIGDDTSPGGQGLTPEQERKRHKFLRMRQKKQEEDRTRKEAELEKKRKREEKQREKEMHQRIEEERRRKEELERQRVEQELRIREAQAARVPDSFATYRRVGPQEQRYDANDDASSYFVQGSTQASGFAEFSGPQCYVKPSGKSNRKIIVNAISYVCLSGTVNQDQKEKCLQAISESDGHHFMILFKDGLKFRGIYLHNLDNDQLFKVFGIGPRVVTSKMVEFLYKYNSGGKEFTKIPSKTISISVDGFSIHKSHWNTGKPVVASKTASNLKRPPRHPQR